MGKEIKQYKINNSFYCQSPLTLRKDQQLFEIISSVGLKDFTDIADMTIADIINLCFKQNILAEFIKIILVPCDEAPPLSDDDILDFDNVLVVEIFTDFFTLNPQLLSLLKSFAGRLDGILKTSI